MDVGGFLYGDQARVLYDVARDLSNDRPVVNISHILQVYKHKWPKLVAMTARD